MCWVGGGVGGGSQSGHTSQCAGLVEGWGVGVSQDTLLNVLGWWRGGGWSQSGHTLLNVLGWWRGGGWGSVRTHTSQCAGSVEGWGVGVSQDTHFSMCWVGGGVEGWGVESVRTHFSMCWVGGGMEGWGVESIRTHTSQHVLGLVEGWRGGGWSQSGHTLLNMSVVKWLAWLASMYRLCLCMYSQSRLEYLVQGTPDLPTPDLPAPDLPGPDLPKPGWGTPDLPKPDLPKPDLPTPDLPTPG